MVFVHIACCYHVCVLHVVVAVAMTFLLGARMELVFCVDVALC
jgi:hypothetical protein